jgi:hypothetical protein
MELLVVTIQPPSNSRYRRASGAHTKQLCHSERSEESDAEGITFSRFTLGFFATLRMTHAS